MRSLKWQSLLLYMLLFILFLPVFLLSLEHPWTEETYLELLHITGETAIRLLIITLIISPLKKLFPAIGPVNWLVKNRRAIGVSSFAFMSMHLSAYLYFNTELSFIIEDFKLMHFIAGWLAFLLILPVAVTSNNLSIRILGGKKWKTVQELVYYATVCAGLHWMLKEAGGLIPAAIHFTPLVIIRIIDIYLEIKNARIRRQMDAK